MTPLLDLHRDLDAQQIALEMVRAMGYEAAIFYLQERQREQIRACKAATERANKILGRDLKERWAA